MPTQPEPSQPAGPKYLTTAEAADILRLTTWQVVNLCRDKKLPATKPFGKWLIEESAITARLAEKHNGAQDAA